MFGFFSTTPILEISLFGIRLSFFQLLLPLAFGLLLINIKRVDLSLDGAGGFFIIWLTISLLSCFFGFLFFNGLSEFQNASISYVFKIAIYFLLFIFLKATRRIDILKCLIYGIYFGIVFNLLWAVIDASIFYIRGISITNTLFRSYIYSHGIRYDSLSLIDGNIIRCSGLNGDPACIGFYSSAVAYYSLKKKKWLIFILSIASVLASISLIALAGIVIIFFYFLFENGKNVAKKIVCILLFSLLALIILFVLAKAIPMVNNVITKMFEAVKNRITLKTKMAGESARTEYFLQFLPAAVLSPIYLFIGTGYGTSSYAYLSNNLTTHIFEPYDPECTYFSYYFDCGLFGFMCFLFMMFILIKWWNKGKNYYNHLYSLVFSMLIGMIIAFWGYHYTLYAPMMIITICSIIIMDYERVGNVLNSTDSSYFPNLFEKQKEIKASKNNI